MANFTKRVKEASPQPASLSNVVRFYELVQSLADAPAHLPTWGVFYGVSGLGKTTAATVTAIKTNSVYVEVGSTWSAGALVEALAHELAIPPIKGAVFRKVQEIIARLSDDPVPLIIDEADHLIKKSVIDVIREISDKSRVPIVLIGEQHLPSKLMVFERAHNRVLSWVKAQPIDLKQARELAKIYATKVEIADDLLQRTLKQTGGCTRYVISNIDRYQKFAILHNLQKLNAEQYVGAVYCGKPFRDDMGEPL